MKIEVHLSEIDPDHLYTVGQVAGYLKRSTSWVRRLIMQDRLSSQKVGVARMIKGSHLIQYLRTDQFSDADRVIVNNTTNQ